MCRGGLVLVAQDIISEAQQNLAITQGVASFFTIPTMTRCPSSSRRSPDSRRLATPS
jgi:hypothetical protein